MLVCVKVLAKWWEVVSGRVRVTTSNDTLWNVSACVGILQWYYSHHSHLFEALAYLLYLEPKADVPYTQYIVGILYWGNLCIGGLGLALSVSDVWTYKGAKLKLRLWASDVKSVMRFVHELNTNVVMYIAYAFEINHTIIQTLGEFIIVVH